MTADSAGGAERADTAAGADAANVDDANGAAGGAGVQGAKADGGAAAARAGDETADTAAESDAARSTARSTGRSAEESAGDAAASGAPPARPDGDAASGAFHYSRGWRRFAVVVLRPLLFALTKRDWKGTRHIPRTGGIIIAANHLSWSDPLALGHYIYEAGRFPTFLAKAPLFDVKVLGPILRRLGQIPVYRHRTDAALALRDAEKALRAGECVIMYPEATCTRDPKLWPMTGKTGTARLALATGAPVIPVAHWGTHELLPYGTKKLRLFPRKTVQVLAGPPVDLSKYEGEPLTAATLRAATDDIMRAIAGLVGELRGEEPPERLYDHREAARYSREKDGTGRAWAT